MTNDQSELRRSDGIFNMLHTATSARLVRGIGSMTASRLISQAAEGPTFHEMTLPIKGIAEPVDAGKPEIPSTNVITFIVGSSANKI